MLNNLHYYLMFFLGILVTSSSNNKEDLYMILGVSRTASTKQIKQAYRKVARDTHPDKNKDIPPERAAEEFHKVVHAFEVLSDESSRKRYDRTGYAGSSSDTDTGGSGGGGQGGYGGFYGGGGFQFFFNRRRGPRMKLKDKFEVKQAQSRVLHVVSLEQLRTIMLDDDDLLERHMLMAFVTPDKIETHVNDEMVFPYPFAAKSEQGIWWEDLLQTVMVRFHKGNEITRFFGLPQGTDMKTPIFLFGRHGEPMTPESFQRIETSRRKDFEAWVWKMIEVVVYFKNEHSHPVEIYWIHGTRANMKGIVQPNATAKHTSMLTHEFMVRDVRVDSRHDSPGRWKLGDKSSLGTYKIGIEGECPPIREDGTIEIIIKTKKCTDLSGHCSFWEYQNECKKNAKFMEEQCPLTCGICEEAEDDDDEPDKEQEQQPPQPSDEQGTDEANHNDKPGESANSKSEEDKTGDNPSSSTPQKKNDDNIDDEQSEDEQDQSTKDSTDSEPKEDKSSGRNDDEL